MDPLGIAPKSPPCEGGVLLLSLRARPSEWWDSHPRPLGPEPSALLDCATPRFESDRGGLAPQTLEGPHPLSRRRPAPGRVHDPASCLGPGGGSRTLPLALMRGGSRLRDAGIVRVWGEWRELHPRPSASQAVVLLPELHPPWVSDRWGLHPRPLAPQASALLLRYGPFVSRSRESRERYPSRSVRDLHPASSVYSRLLVSPQVGARPMLPAGFAPAISGFGGRRPLC